MQFGSSNLSSFLLLFINLGVLVTSFTDPGRLQVTGTDSAYLLFILTFVACGSALTTAFQLPYFRGDHLYFPPNAVLGWFILEEK